MEKIVNKRIEDYLVSFKNSFKEKVLELEFKETEKLNEVLEFVFEYPKLCIEKEEVVKKRRVKSEISATDRCIAKRATGEQCTRRKKRDCEYCGTHDRLLSNGLSENIQQQDVYAEDIQGIIHYVDGNNNVYSTEDVLLGKLNPKIIGKALRENNYTTVAYSETV